MDRIKVAIEKFSNGSDIVKKAVENAGAFKHLSPGSKVVLKPNIVVWLNGPFPKWGVITTSAVMEETVRLLKDHGIDDISIAEGSLQLNPNEKKLMHKAYRGLGYDRLENRYGVKLIDIWKRPFETVFIDGELKLKVNADLLSSDFLVNLPVLKTHAQVKVSLGIKNLKGFLSVASRKKCHNPDSIKDLDYMVSRLPELLPPSATIIDGIYTLERGPSFEGKSVRTDLIIASPDPLAADLVGAKVLGYNPERVPYLHQASVERNLSTDLSGIEIMGENIADVEKFHQYTFPYNEDNTLPLAMEKMGIKGLNFYKFDSTVCTYCSLIIGQLLTIIGMGYKGKPFDDVEFLTGKRLNPSDDMKTTILVGQCMCKKHKNHDGLQEMVEIKGCPPDPKLAAQALKTLGVDVDPSYFTNFEAIGSFFMERFKGKPEFDPDHFVIN